MKFCNIVSTVGLLILGVFLSAVHILVDVILPVAFMIVIVIAAVVTVTSPIWLPILLILAL